MRLADLRREMTDLDSAERSQKPGSARRFSRFSTSVRRSEISKIASELI
jgi:hypothetical protein